jgi:soluble lytic murein transglycosylase-like protein
VVLVSRLARGAAALTAVAVLAGGGQAAARTHLVRRAGRAAPAASPAPGATTYRVRSGDTLTAIAQRTGTTVSELVQLNRIRRAGQIRIGAVLQLPPPQGSARLPERLRQAPERLKLMPEFNKAASRRGAPADLLKAVTWMESGWQNDKVSSTKAVGIGQLTADTVAFVNSALLRGTRLDPKKPIDNINLSARFLAYLLQQTHGDVPTAVAAYYQGLASVRAKGPQADTKAYVANVLALRSQF